MKRKEAYSENKFDIAFLLAKEASEAGDLDATNLLGILYERGLGVNRNIGEALILYEFAAAGGQAKAIYNLGKLLLNKEHDFFDPQKGEELLKNALELEILDAATQLSLAYYYGLVPGKGEEDATKSC